MLDALTHKVYGIFPTLDSECFMPGGCDSTLLHKVLSASSTCSAILNVGKMAASKNLIIFVLFFSATSLEAARTIWYQSLCRSGVLRSAQYGR